MRIGDLVENAGIVAKVPIFRAPDLGVDRHGVGRSAWSRRCAPHALVGLDTGDVSEVVVTRASRTIPAKDIEDDRRAGAVGAIRARPRKDIAVNFDRELRAIQVEPTAKGEPRVAYLNYDSRSGRFDVTLDMPTGATARGTLRLTGRAAATAEVVTLLAADRARRGDQGAPTWWSSGARAPRSAATSSTIADQAVGLAARSAMQPGRPLRIADLMKPELVQRNETVTLVYQVPGITLTVRGKAAEGGAEGDVISVLNEQSKRTVQGVVVGPGRVVISTGSPRLAANLPPAGEAMA